MPLTRVTIDDESKATAEEILKSTGIKSLSQLFTIFIVNYGDDLVSALQNKRQPKTIAVNTFESFNNL